MASTTPNIGLTKPAGTEQALISIINGDMDIIDSKMGAVPQNKNVQGQIDSLSDQIAYNSGVITVPRTTGNTNSFYKYIKTGNVVTVYIEHHASDATINAWSSLDFPSLPSGFRPSMDIVAPASTDRTGSSGMIGYIYPSGIVRLACKYNGMTDSSDIARTTLTYAVPY